MNSQNQQTFKKVMKYYNTSVNWNLEELLGKFRKNSLNLQNLKQRLLKHKNASSFGTSS